MWNKIREIFFSLIRCETRDGKVGDLREPTRVEFQRILE